MEANLKVCLVYPFSLSWNIRLGTFSIDHSSPCKRAHQNDCVEVGGIDSGCTVMEDCSVSVKRDKIRKANYFVYSRGMYYLYGTNCSF